jgi:hypothetical protein
MTEDEEEIWWERFARVIGDLLSYELDWMDAANCLVDEVEDTSFIREPDEITERRWARTCSKCQVFTQCLQWADRTKVSGVYVAGEWRE